MRFAKLVKNTLIVITVIGGLFIGKSSEIKAATNTEITKITIPEDVIASGVVDEKYGQITWLIDKEGHLVVSGTGDARDPGDVTKLEAQWPVEPFPFPWGKYKESIVTAEINVTGMKNASELLQGCSKLKAVDMSGFDTSQIVYMRNMFSLCRNLTELDMSGFNTSEVRSMLNMFMGCEKLTELDLSSFDTTNVTNMSNIFMYCKNLTELDVSSFDTTNVTQMDCMFMGCEKLTELDLSSFDTSNVVDMYATFLDCKNLEKVDLNGFNTTNVTDMSCMFMGCEKLTELDLSNFNTSQVVYISGMFEGCGNLESLDLSSFNLEKVEIEREIGAVDLFFNCNKLEYIQTPCNLKFSDVLLPTTVDNDTWFRFDGTKIQYLPANLPWSIVISKNNIPKDITLFDEPEILQDKKSGLKIVDSITGEPIAGAVVIADGVKYTADSEGIVRELSDGILEIKVKADNYYDIKIIKDLQEGGYGLIKMTAISEDLNIYSAQANFGSDDVDVLDEITYLTNKDYEESENDNPGKFVIKIGTSGKAVKYRLVQNGEIIQENSTGIFEIPGKIELLNKHRVYYTNALKAGYKVYVHALDEDNNIVKQQLGIKVSDSSNVDASWNFIYGGEENPISLDFLHEEFSVPNDVPIFGGSVFEYGIEGCDLPVMITVDDDGKLRVAVGTEDYKGILKDGKMLNWDAFEEQYQKEVKEATRNLLQQYENTGKSDIFSTGSVKIGGEVWGYGECYLKDAVNSRLRLNLGLIIKVSGEAKSKQYMYAYVPIFINYGIGGELEAEGSVQMIWESGKTPEWNGGDLVLAPSFQLTLDGGVGVDEVLSVGTYGTGKFTWTMDCANDYQKVDFNGNAKIRATALSWSKVLAEFDDTYLLYDSNWNKNSIYYYLADSEESYLDMSCAELITMEYMNQRNATPKVFRNIEIDSESMTLLDYAYENASPRLLQVNDTLYLFYLDGVEGRKAYNQTALFYKTSEDDGITWSEAIRVDNRENETADYSYDVATDGKNVYAVWSESSEVLGDDVETMDSTTALRYAASKMDLMFAKINAESKKVETYTISTPNADMQPKVTVDDSNGVYISWLTNNLDSNHLFSTGNRFGIAYASLWGGFKINQEILPEGNYPLSLDIGRYNDSVYIVVDTDVDENLETQEDREIYLIDIRSVEPELKAFTNNKKVDSIPRFADINGTTALFWYQDGKIVYTSEGGSVDQVFKSESMKSIGQQFTVLEGENGNAAVVWTSTSQEEGGNVNLFCTNYDGEKWSDVYKLSELNSDYTTEISGHLNGEDARMVYLGTLEEGDTICSNICMLNPKERIDTDVKYSADINGILGNNYPITLEISNTGNVMIDTVEIISEDGRYSKKFSSLNLAPGNSKILVYEGIILPTEMSEAFSCNLKVKAEGETELDDNIVCIFVGNPDLEIETTHDFAHGIDYASVSVKNLGLVEADALVTIYKDENHKEKLYEIDFGKIKPNETKVQLVDLEALDKYAEIFYFVVSEKNNKENYLNDNEDFIYVGKGSFMERQETLTVPEEVCKVFADVKHNSWYEVNVQYVYDKGLMVGNNGLFNPMEQITRAQFVTTLYRLAGSIEVTDYSACDAFKDVEKNKYYTDAVCWAYNIGIATGDPVTRMFNTTGVLKRQQLGAFLYRFAEYSGFEISSRANISEMLGAEKVSSYAKDSMEWAVGVGLINGSVIETDIYGNEIRDLKPLEGATRAQLATILQRFCEANY